LIELIQLSLLFVKNEYTESESYIVVAFQFLKIPWKETKTSVPSKKRSFFAIILFCHCPISKPTGVRMNPRLFCLGNRNVLSRPEKLLQKMA
jgi:hypothetical protein